MVQPSAFPDLPASNLDAGLPASICITLPLSERTHAESVDSNHPIPKIRSPKLGDLGGFWKSMDRTTDDCDKDMLDALKSNMDNLLIFVSLFVLCSYRTR